MFREWLIGRCESTDPRAIRLREMASLQLSDENKQKLLDRSEPFRKWAEERWKPFIALMQPGDELWQFRSPDHTWANLAGRAGYAILRDGEIVHSLVTLLN
jgi:hypothetical protein